jgi:hypothetical protein
MDFKSAMRLILNGSRVGRKGKSITKLSKEDILADDWEVLEAQDKKSVPQREEYLNK